MTPIVFSILLQFTDWDDCWNFYHANREALDNVELSHFCVEDEAVTYGPSYSLRPKSREDKQ